MSVRSESRLISSVEYLRIRVSSSHDITDRPVSIKVGTRDWEAAEYVEDEDVWRILLSPSESPALALGNHRILVRIDDTTEQPVLVAGSIFLRT